MTWHQRLEAAPHWHMDKHIRKRHQWSCWSMKKWLHVCVEAQNYHSKHSKWRRVLSQPQQSTDKNMLCFTSLFNDGMRQTRYLRQICWDGVEHDLESLSLPHRMQVCNKWTKKINGFTCKMGSKLVTVNATLCPTVMQIIRLNRIWQYMLSAGAVSSCVPVSASHFSVHYWTAANNWLVLLWFYSDCSATNDWPHSLTCLLLWPCWPHPRSSEYNKLLVLRSWMASRGSQEFCSLGPTLWTVCSLCYLNH